MNYNNNNNNNNDNDNDKYLQDLCVREMVTRAAKHTMRKYLMSLLAVMFLLSSLTLFAQPRAGQDAMKQDAAQSDTAKAPKKAKKEKKA